MIESVQITINEPFELTYIDENDNVVSLGKFRGGEVIYAVALDDEPAQLADELPSEATLEAMLRKASLTEGTKLGGELADRLTEIEREQLAKQASFFAYKPDSINGEPATREQCSPARRAELEEIDAASPAAVVEYIRTHGPIVVSDPGYLIDPVTNKRIPT